MSTATSTSAPALAAQVHVSHLGGDRFDIEIGGHTITVDQPVDNGGEGTAPTPTELLVASLVSCVAFYARRYLARHGLDTVGLDVHAAYQLADRPARVASMDLQLTVPAGTPQTRLQPLLAVARHCTVHNTLKDPPDITITLAGQDAPAQPRSGATT
jgi:uncharacterized OsmC-like protein